MTTVRVHVLLILRQRLSEYPKKSICHAHRCRRRHRPDRLPAHRPRPQGGPRGRRDRPRDRLRPARRPTPAGSRPPWPARMRSWTSPRPAIDEAASTDFFTTVAAQPRPGWRPQPASSAASTSRSSASTRATTTPTTVAKLAHEQATREGRTPVRVVLRATQFHDFARQMFEWNTRRRRHPGHGRPPPARRHRRDRPGPPRPSPPARRPRRRAGRPAAGAAGRPRASGTPPTSAPTSPSSPTDAAAEHGGAARCCPTATASCSAVSTGRPGWRASRA